MNTKTNVHMDDILNRKFKQFGQCFNYTLWHKLQEKKITIQLKVLRKAIMNTVLLRGGVVQTDMNWLIP
ncbi:hypothetical protein QL285_023483 [Trifolium repens]|nr:hypothetical protein QL285_023483 [Trifolium repens]